MARISMIPHLADVSGAQLALLEVIDAIDRSRHEIEVICPSEGPFSERLERMNVRWRVIKNPVVALTEQAGVLQRLGVMQARLLYFEKLREYFRRSATDLALVNTSINIYAGLAARAAGIKIIYFVHEILEPNAINRFKCGIVERCSHLILAPALANASMFHPAAQQAKFRHIPLGVDLERFAGRGERRELARRQLGLAYNEIAVGIICQITRNKAVDILLQAAKKIVDGSSRYKFFVIGSPDPHAREYYQGLRDYVYEHDLQGVVQFVPYTENIEEVFSSLDIFVLASRSESSPRVILEAMAASVPVVATAVGGVPELIEHQKTGLLVSPDAVDELAGAIRRLAEDRSLRKVIGEAGRDYVRKHHAPEQFQERIRRVIDSIL